MIRFQRTGRKNDASFRIAVLEKTAGPKAGKYVDLVGTYNPKTKAASLKPDAIKDWVAKGAQVSPSVHNLLVNQGVVEGPKSAKVVKQSELGKNIAKKAEEEAAAAKAAEEAAAKAAADAKAAEEASAAEAESAAPEEQPAAEEATPSEETVDTTPENITEPAGDLAEEQPANQRAPDVAPAEEAADEASAA